MKIIYNSTIPFKGFIAITVCKWIFARKEYKDLSSRIINHESIHMAEEDDFIIPILKYILFYVWYLLEWIMKLPFTVLGYNAYKSISFEIEAYEHENNLDYLKTRKRFAWLKNVFKLRK